MNRPYVPSNRHFFRSQVRVLFVSARVQFDFRFAIPGEGGKTTIKRNFLPPNKPRTSESAHTLEVGPDLDLEDEADNWQRAASCKGDGGVDHSDPLESQRVLAAHLLNDDVKETTYQVHDSLHQSRSKWDYGRS